MLEGAEKSVLEAHGVVRSIALVVELLSGDSQVDFN